MDILTLATTLAKPAWLTVALTPWCGRGIDGDAHAVVPTVLAVDTLVLELAPWTVVQPVTQALPQQGTTVARAVFFERLAC